MTSQPAQRTATDRSKHLFLTPAAILILVLSIFPLIFSLVLTFVSWDLSRLEGGIRFYGLNNFITLGRDTRFWHTARVTFTFVIGAVALQYCLGLGIAILLNQEIRFRRFFRVVFLIPMMLTPAAVGYVGRMLPAVVIILPFVIMYRVAGLIDTCQGMILAYTVFNLPFAVWILRDFFAGLPIDLEESALIDGASRLQAFYTRHGLR
jgi:multiple sugar transport system permease protein